VWEWARGGSGEVTFRRGEVNHVPVLLEHVDLFDGLDRLHIQLLEGGLEFFVVGARGLVDFLYFSSRRAFASFAWGGELAAITYRSVLVGPLPSEAVEAL